MNAGLPPDMQESKTTDSNKCSSTGSEEGVKGKLVKSNFVVGMWETNRRCLREPAGVRPYQNMWSYRQSYACSVLFSI
jgi:ribosomal protein S14